MHEEFYLNGKHTILEQLNEMFNDGIQIRDFLRVNQVQCGYMLDCTANLRPAMFKETNLVYLRSVDKKQHLEICPYNDLLKIREKMIKNGSLDFLITNFPKRIKILKGINQTDKLIAAEYKTSHIKLSELFNLLKNDLKLEFLKETSFIDPEHCEEWYEKNHHVINNAVLLTGYLTRKFYSCKNENCIQNKRSYDCRLRMPKHETKDYKIEIKEKDIEFHITVSKEIYNSIEINNSKLKMYHILAKINEIKTSNKENKRFFTKNNKLEQHIVKDKKYLEEVSIVYFK